MIARPHDPVVRVSSVGLVLTRLGLTTAFSADGYQINRHSKTTRRQIGGRPLDIKQALGALEEMSAAVRLSAAAERFLAVPLSPARCVQANRAPLRLL